jgi:hypothetical protein
MTPADAVLDPQDKTTAWTVQLHSSVLDALPHL